MAATPKGAQQGAQQALDEGAEIILGSAVCAGDARGRPADPGRVGCP